MMLKIMGKFDKGSAALIIIGIVGLVVALAVGYLFWRGILRWWITMIAKADSIVSVIIVCIYSSCWGVTKVSRSWLTYLEMYSGFKCLKHWLFIGDAKRLVTRKFEIIRKPRRNFLIIK